MSAFKRNDDEKSTAKNKSKTKLIPQKTAETQTNAVFDVEFPLRNVTSRNSKNAKNEIRRLNIATVRRKFVSKSSSALENLIN